MINQATKQVNTNLVISELYKAFNLFNDELFRGQLPEPAILIQSKGNKKLTFGWCTVREERYEINLIMEALNRGILEVMGILLHEMVHLYNLINNIKDTSRGGTYHNKQFKVIAEQHGLLVEQAEKVGWAIVSLQDETIELIESANFNEVIFGFKKSVFLDGEKEIKKKKTSSRKYICPECGTTIRASKDVFILCGSCSNLGEGKAVTMVKEQSEDSEGIKPQLTEEIKPQLKEESKIITKSPIEIVEVDTVLIDGDGKPVPVKQGMIKIKKEWTTEAIFYILNEAQKQAEALELEAPAYDLPIEINPKMISQYALYKEGKNLTFSKNYLAEASEDEIIDTIKHQYLHHYQFIVEGLKVNHKKPFKDLCEQFGLDTKVPTKNHRAMK